MTIHTLSRMEQHARERICLALDLVDEDLIDRCIGELSPFVGYFKLNSAFAEFGAPVIKRILESGSKVFLDLKIHDIPSTAAGYAVAATKLGVDIVTVHTAGGLQMMSAAIDAADRMAGELGTVRPKFVGVTVLTSIDEDVMNHEVGIPGKVFEEVARKAQLAAGARLDGIVCAPDEVAALKPSLPPHFFYVTPGVRAQGTDADDHRRTATCADAIKAGAGLVVVGRALTRARDLQSTARELLQEIVGEM